jgi:hypothetical protein
MTPWCPICRTGGESKFAALDLLVATKWLAEDRTSDRSAIGQAISAMIKDAAKGRR